MPVCQRGFACGETARAVIGPAFWVCRAKSGAAFRCAKPPCAVVRFAAMTSSPRTDVLACPAFALLSHSPTALLNIPALVAVRLHFAARNHAGRSLPPPGQRARYPIFASLKCGPAYSRGVCRGTFLCSTAGPALAPRRLSPFGSISLRETALAGRCPAGGNVLVTPFSLRSNVAPHIPAGSAGYVPLFHGWPRARTPAQAAAAASAPAVFAAAETVSSATRAAAAPRRMARMKCPARRQAMYISPPRLFSFVFSFSFFLLF